MPVSFVHTTPLAQAAAISSMSLPSQSLVRKHLESRLQAETNNNTSPENPGFNHVSRAAMWVYSQRRHVDSYPLLYTALALAHPN